MPLRYGEMVLIVRTQDFASRNLARVTDNIGKLSRAQQLANRQSELALRQARVATRQQGLREDLGNVRVLQQEIAARKELSALTARQGEIEARNQALQRGRVRGAGGRFVSPAPELAALAAESNKLIAREAALQAELRQLEQQVARMPSSFRRLANSEADVEARAARLQRALALTRGELAHLQIAQNQIAGARDLANSWERLHTAGLALSRIGRVFQLTGLAGTAALGGAAKSAADFDTQITRAATQAADIQSKGFEDVSRKAEQFSGIVQDAMSRFPASSEEMANSLYEIFSTFDLQGSKAVQHGTELFNLFNKAAVGGFTDLGTATDLGISALSNFDKNLENPTAVLNRMFAIIKFGKVDMERLAQMMGKVAPAAAAANQSLNDVSGAIDLLTIQGGKAPQAATQFARLLQAFSDPRLQDGLAKAGVKITDVFGRLKPLPQIINDIAKAFPELRRGEGLSRFFQVFTSVGVGRGRGRQFTAEAQRALTFLITNLDRYNQLQRDTVRDNAQFSRSVAAGLNSDGVRWKIFVNNVHRLILQLGDAAIPVFQDIGKVIKFISDQFDEMSPRTKRMIGLFLGFAAIGSLVGGAAFAIIGGLTSLTSTIGLFTGKLGKGTAEAGRFSGVLSGLMRFAGITIGLSIILDLIKKGDLNAWDFLIGALAGAAVGGLAFGPIGAVVGAITVPIILAIKMKLDAPDPDEWNHALIQFSKTLSPQVGERLREGVLKAEYKGGTTAGEQFAFQFLKKIKAKVPKETADLLFADIPDVVAKSKRAAEQHTKVVKTQNQKEDQIRRGNLAAWENYYKKLNSYANESAKYQAQLAQTRARAEEDAMNQVNQAAANMANLFDQFKQQNQAAFGELFQGPFLTGESFDLAREWGIKPAMQDLQKDLEMSLQRFQNWRGVLARLARRGLPPEMIKMLQGLGIDALDNLETLANSSPAKLNRYVATWQKSQKAINAATKVDFNSQLAAWRKYGSDIFQQIIFGLRDGDHVALQEAYKKYILATFPNFIQEVVNKAITDFQTGNVQPPKPPKAPPGSPAVAAVLAAQAQAGSAGGGAVQSAVVSSVLGAMYQNARDVRRSMAPASRDAYTWVGTRPVDTRPVVTHTHYHETTNTTVVGYPNEDPRDTARRAAFDFKHAKRSRRPKPQPPVGITHQ